MAMSKANLLSQLQEIDLEIKQKTGTLAQAKEQLGKDDDLVSARAGLDATHKRMLDIEHQQRAAEFGVEELEQKIAAEEKKLYEGSVKNPRELMSIQQEIDSIKGRCRERDEQLLAIMEEVDAAKRDAALKGSDLEAQEGQWHEDQKRLAREQTELEADLAILEPKRAAFAGQIDSESLAAYEDLRRVKQGLAVAKLVQGRCNGCRISLPVAAQQKARAGHQLATCSNCGRILYVD